MIARRRSHRSTYVRDCPECPDHLLVSEIALPESPVPAVRDRDDDGVIQNGESQGTCPRGIIACHRHARGSGAETETREPTGGSVPRLYRLIAARIMRLRLVASLGISTAYTHDPMRPELNTWFKRLKNKVGEACRDTGDGHHAEAVCGAATFLDRVVDPHEQTIGQLTRLRAIALSAAARRKEG